MAEHLLIDKVIHPFGRPQRLRVWQPSGAGIGYQILLDNYFIGQLIKRSTGWTVDLRDESNLPMEYCDAIVDKAIREGV